MTLPEIRAQGLEALLDRLGPEGTVRFLQQYDPGHGDYTHARGAWLDQLTVDEVAESIRKRAATQPGSPRSSRRRPAAKPRKRRPAGNR